MKIHTIIVAVAITMMYGDEFVYRLPPITHSTREERYERFLNDGKKLMDIKGIPDESDTLVCTNWACPTSIVVNAVRYSLATDEWAGVISADIMTTDLSSAKRGRIRIYRESNAKEARRSVFASYNQSTSLSAATVASFVGAYNLDPATNMLVVSDTRHGGTNKLFVVYKNLAVRAYAPTNAVDFAAEIINAGLPEDDRIILPPAP